MKSLAMKMIVALAALVLAAAGACNGQTSAGNGSETNWLSLCEEDADCASGACLCNICTTACDESTPCPGDPSIRVCAGPPSGAFSTVCGDESSIGGVCFKRCTGDVECGEGLRCEDGACVPWVVGVPCIPGDESVVTFSGFSETEINVEARSPSCAMGVCLVYNFRGRVTCPYGQPADPTNPDQVDPSQQTCATPEGAPVTVPVAPQIADRRAIDAVYCTCRCAGPGEGPFCPCPSGFECTPVIRDLGFGSRDRAGSYCIKAGTEITDPNSLQSHASCSEALQNCETSTP